MNIYQERKSKHFASIRKNIEKPREVLNFRGFLHFELSKKLVKNWLDKIILFLCNIFFLKSYIRSMRVIVQNWDVKETV